MAYPVYILYGPESGERQRSIDSIRETLFAEHGDGLEIIKYYATEDGVSDIISALSNGALFSTHSLAIIQNAEVINKKAEIKLFAEYLKKPNPDCTIIFTSEETKLEKALINLAQGPAVKVFWELFENQREGWVVNYLRKQDSIITAEALELFLSLVEGNTQGMKHELDKMLLISDASEGKLTITEEMVENYIYHSREESVYSLFNAYANRDFASALEILHKLRGVKSGEETAILIRFVYQLRQLAGLSQIRDTRGIQSGDYMKLRIFGKMNQNRFQRLLQRLDSKTIKRHIRSCAEFEMQLRQQKTGLHAHIIELWLYSLFFEPVVPATGTVDERLFSIDRSRFV